ncbi:hypothetical protein AgCh_021666 [Apium graveolens]
MCVGDVEHMNHLFIDCNYAKDCWHEVGLNFDMIEEEYANVWLLNMMEKAPDDIVIKISIVLWGIWYARYKRIFESKNISPGVVISWSKKEVEEWKSANKRNMNMQGTGENRTMNEFNWKPPEADQLKINVDASVVAGQNSFTIGMIIRNQQGHYIAGKTMRFAGGVSVEEAELTGILEAILWSQEVAHGHVIVESDSLISVKAVNQGHDSVLEFGDLVQQWQKLLRSNGRIYFSHIKKQANKVAHTLVRFPSEFNSFSLISSPPDFLLETLLSDVLMV